jgi:16S rRNA (adenine1518-N6/adenine1519-N6)-dimethyltransferase
VSAKKPKLGQNFLVDPNARQRIVEALGDISASTVLEIGPGRGALTDLLAARARRLIAVELDRILAPQLIERWKHTSNIKILQSDILEVDFPALLESPQERLDVVGNLPYYITSDILLHLFSHVGAIRRAVVMVQEEVADRLAAHPGVRDYGALSATAQMHGRIDKLFALPPDAFSPAPNVNSAVVRIEMAPCFEELQVAREPFLRFLQLCFRQKRKTLANNLRSAKIADTADAVAAVEAAGLAPDVRAEAVSLIEMARLFRELNFR